jgi:hypothetical protein
MPIRRPVKLASKLHAKKVAQELEKASQAEASSIAERPVEPIEIVDPELEAILEKLREPCEIVANVTFWTSKESSLVAILTKAELTQIQCGTDSFKVMSQSELLKKGITEVPTWEYGANTREKLSKTPRFHLHEEDKAALAEARRIKKKLAEEERKMMEEDMAADLEKKRAVNVEGEE